MKPLIVITNFLAVLNFSMTLNVECIFKNDGDWTILTNVYYCKVLKNLNIETIDKSIIDSMTGVHLDGMSTNDVIGIEMEDLNIKWFPHGLKKFFNNLKIIDINYGRIKEIRQADLKPFTELEVIDLQENDIYVLEEGIFDLNPNLRMVWLKSNRIIHIDAGLFDDLTELTYLSLESNFCIDLEAEDNSTALQEILDNLKDNCQNWSFTLLRGKIKELRNELRYIRKMIKDGSNENNFKDIMEKLEEIERKVENNSKRNEYDNGCGVLSNRSRLLVVTFIVMVLKLIS